MRTIIAALVVTIIGHGPSNSQDCSPNVVNAMKFAKRWGLDHNGAPSVGGGKCEIIADGESFLASAKSDGLLRCQFSIFSGRKLAGGWKLVSVELAKPGGGGSMEARLVTSDNEQKVTFEVEATAGDSVQYYLKSVRLSGGSSCTEWAKAFGQ